MYFSELEHQSASCKVKKFPYVLIGPEIPSLTMKMVPGKEFKVELYNRVTERDRKDDI
jgi:hypothetical protein